METLIITKDFEIAGRHSLAHSVNSPASVNSAVVLSQTSDIESHVTKVESAHDAST